MKKYLILAFLLICFVSSGAFAAYPENPINMILPTTAGAGWDLASRTITDEWSRLLEQPFRYSYAPGASGMIALRQIVTGPQEGYETSVMTLNMVNVTNFVQKNSPANWENMTFVGNIMSEQDAVFVHKDSPFKTIQELVEYGQTNTLKISTPHPTAIATLAALIFIEKTGIKANVVSFNSGGEARKALAGKHVDMSVSVTASAIQLKDFLRGLAVFDDHNLAKGTFDMPPINEALPGYDFPSFVEPFAVVVSRQFSEKFPTDYIKLYETFKQAHESEATKEKAEGMGLAPFMDYWSPEKCAEFVKDFEETLAKFAHLIRKQ